MCKNMPLLLLYILTHLVACKCSQLHGRANNIIQQSQSQPTKWMTITKLQIPSQQEVKGIHRLMYHISYDISYINRTQGFYLYTQTGRISGDITKQHVIRPEFVYVNLLYLCDCWFIIVLLINNKNAPALIKI